MSERVLVVVAHPDDEVIGCGGALLRHRDNGDSIHIVTLTNGVSSRGNNDGLDKRNASLESVTSRLQASHFCFDFEDNQLDSYPLLEVVKSIENEVNKFAPTTVYTHHYGDLNVDHRCCYNAILTACRPQPMTTIKKILSFEICSSTEWNYPRRDMAFIPNYYIDISEYIDEKMSLMEIYDDEMREFPHARSYEAIRSKSTTRGVEVGVRSAEAFSLIREII